MVPDAVTPISFNIWDKFHTFKKGHRIMVQVHSSWFPIFDRNPQTFTNIYRAGKSDYRTATQRIYRSSGSPSHLVLPIVANRAPERAAPATQATPEASSHARETPRP